MVSAHLTCPFTLVLLQVTHKPPIFYVEGAYMYHEGHDPRPRGADACMLAARLPCRTPCPLPQSLPAVHALDIVLCPASADLRPASCAARKYNVFSTYQQHNSRQVVPEASETHCAITSSLVLQAGRRGRPPRGLRRPLTWLQTI